MQFIPFAFLSVAAVLLVLAIYRVKQGDGQKAYHLFADAVLFLYVGYIGIGPLPPSTIVIGGAVLVVLLLSYSGWLYNKTRQQANSVVAWLGALAVTGVTLAYYLGFLK